MSTDWRGVDDSGPRLGRRGLTWFRCYVRSVVREVLRVGDAGAAALLEPLVDWYTERVQEFVYWQADAEYHGARYSWGCWKCKGLAARLREAYNEVCTEVGLPPMSPAPSPSAKPTPPREHPIPPGPIDMDAALQELASPTQRFPEERSAYWFLDHRSESYQRLKKQRNRCESNMPRTCQSCGETFTSGTPGGAVTCKACKAARRKRCVRCSQVFTADSTKEKRCIPCLKKAAEVGDATAAELLRRKEAAVEQVPGCPKNRGRPA